MATNKKAQVVITCDGKTALKVTEMLRQKIEEIKNEMKSLDVTTKAGAKRQKELEKELFAYNSAQQENISNYQRMQHAIKNLSTTSLKDLKRALSAAKSELGKLSEEDKRLPMVQQRVKTLQEQVDKLTGSVKKQGGAWSTAMKNLTAYVGLFAVFNKAKELFTDFFKLNQQFADQLTNVRKVALISNEEVAQLANSLAKMDTRTSIEELNQIAYAGAKMGVQTKGGITALSEFVRAADQVNVALKEDLGEEALTALAKVTEVMGLIDKLGVEDSMLRVGSSIFRLASTSTATSGKIIDFTNRMMALGEQAALTTPDVLAIGAAVDSMALSPEVAATAFGKLFVSMREGTLGIEKDLGIVEGTLKDMLADGRGAEALLTLFRKMGETGNVFALDGLFKDLGSDGQKLITTMVTMADKNGMLERSLKESNKAFEEGTAVTVEYNMQQETAKAYMERATNAWEKFFVNAQNANGPIKEIAQSWFEMTQTLLGAGEATGGFQMAIDLLVFSVKAFINLLPGLVSGLLGKGFGAAIVKLIPMIKALGSLSVGVFQSMIQSIQTGAMTVGSFTTKWKAMDAAMKSNVIGLAVGVFTQLAFWIYEAGKAANELINKESELAKIQREAAKQAQEQIVDVQTLAMVARDETAALDDRITAINKLNELIPDYNAYLDETTGKYVENKEALDKYVESLIHMYEVEGAKAKLAELGRKKADAKTDKFNAQKEYERSKAPSAKDNPMAYVGGNAAAIGMNKIESDAKKKVEEAQARYDQAVKEEEEILAAYRDDIAKSVKVKADGVDVGDNKCPQCGAALPKGAKKCPHCGWGTKPKGNGAQEKEWRQQLKEAQSDANAIIDKIKNYYERQILEVTEKANSLNLDEAQTEALTRPIRAKMNDALAVARKAISNVEQGWDTFKQTMQDDMIEVMGENGLNESQMLLDQIEKADLKALQEKIATLSKSLNRPESALMDQIWRNATKNAQANADAERKQREEIQKILLEHNYTGIVDNNTTQQMEKIGAFGLSAKQVQTLLGGKEGEAEALLAEREKQIKQLLEKARTNIVDILSTDLDKEGGRDKFLTAILGNKEDWQKNSSELSAILNMDKENLKAFFYELIKYNDEYDAAMKKKADERKKLNDYGFSKTTTSKFDQAAIDLSTEQNKESKRQYSFGAKNDAISPWGQTEATDPELALLQLKMKLAKDYYDYIAAHGATDEQLIEAGKNVQEAYSSIMDAVVAKAQATAEAQRKWYKPIEQYGTALGEAVFDESKTVKKATQDMINSFIDLTGEYVNQKITQWVMTKLYNQFMAQSEEELAVTKQTVAAENATTAVTEAGVEVAAGEAAAGAKTLGQLGWWGIPLLAVIGAVLGGLLSMAKGALNSAFGGGDTADTAKGPNTKLVSGMLTYDSGNVQDLKPFFDKDGNMYWATEDDDRNHDGINLLTKPTATTINGAPSLVAEQGPELVIGRETTQAMMQNNPALLKALYQYDKHHSGRTAYDHGNLSEQLASLSSAVAPGASGEGMTTALADATASNVALLTAVNALLSRLDEPIEAYINMYGTNGLHKKLQQANQFMKGK